MPRRFRLTGGNDADGAEFEMPDDATEGQIAQAAADTFLEFSSFGWEEQTDGSEE